MSRKLTIEDAIMRFEKRGFVLLEKEYKNNAIPMEYKCDQGHITKITLNSLKDGKGCKFCASKKRSDKMKFDFNYVKQFFIDNRCELLETDYKGCFVIMKYKCENGHISYTSFNNFKKGARCKKCFEDRERLDIEFIRNKFIENNCIPLFENYINSREKLKYKCECGNISYISFYSFLGGSRCKKCGIIKQSNNSRLDISYIKSKFIEKDCVPLFEDNDYKNSKSKLKYRCHCGNISEITFANLINSNGCWECKGIRQSGPNSALWKGGIAKEPYCCNWIPEYKEEIKERDGYKCLNPMCNHKSNRLTCHHINYNKKDCHPKNLITLCTSCNTKANFDREWHQSFYSEMVNKRYYNKNKIANMLDI